MDAQAIAKAVSILKNCPLKKGKKVGERGSDKLFYFFKGSFFVILQKNRMDK